MSNLKNLLRNLRVAIGEDMEMMSQMPNPTMMTQMPSVPMVGEMPEIEDSMNGAEMEVEDSGRDMEDETREMLLSDLRSMIVNAQDVVTHIENGAEIEAWMNSKIVIAAENVSSVRNSLIGEKE